MAARKTDPTFGITGLPFSAMRSLARTVPSPGLCSQDHARFFNPSRVSSGQRRWATVPGHDRTRRGHGRSLNKDWGPGSWKCWSVCCAGGCGATQSLKSSSPEVAPLRMPGSSVPERGNPRQIQEENALDLYSKYAPSFKFRKIFFC